MLQSTQALSFDEKLTLGWGKVRRAFYIFFRSDYVERKKSTREGECLRCGACCKLMLVCPYLDESESPHICTKYDTRSRHCRHFPIDARDLNDRDLVMPSIKCGFRFSG